MHAFYLFYTAGLSMGKTSHGKMRLVLPIVFPQTVERPEMSRLVIQIWNHKFGTKTSNFANFIT